MFYKDERKSNHDGLIQKIKSMLHRLKYIFTGVHGPNFFEYEQKNIKTPFHCYSFYLDFRLKKHKSD